MTEYEAFIAAGCESVADKKRWDAAVAFEREACARLIEPKNEQSDWTEYAKIHAKCAASIRARK